MAEHANFIVFEGPEGAGKSTQITRLQARLEAEHIRPVLTREPGGTPAANEIRKVILDPGLIIDPLPEFLLYSASRAQHVAEIIKPALDTGKTVVSDRFSGASIAYQGYGRGLDLTFIHDLTARVTQGIKPDLVLLLDINPEVGLKRVAARGQKDRLELADLSFHQRVRGGFLAQAEADESWHTVNAAQAPDVVETEIWNAVARKLSL